MRIRSPFLHRLAARIAVYTVKAFLWTCKTEIQQHTLGNSPFRLAPDAVGKKIYSVWHDQLIPATFMGSGSNSTALVSEHRDGELLAESMRLLDVKTARGSSTRGGVKALRQMLESIRDTHLVLTPDGPRGPRRTLKEGVLFLAAKSKRPVVPIVCRVERFWSLNGRWSNLVIPKPFGRVLVVFGEPFRVPEKLHRSEYAEYLERLQKQIDELQAEVDALPNGGRMPYPVADERIQTVNSSADVEQDDAEQDGDEDVLQAA